MATDDLLTLHLDVCAAELSWCMVPHQPVPADLRLLARAMVTNASRAFETPLDESALASELLIAAAERVVWRGEVDAAERAEWQVERIQSAWAALNSAAH